MDRFSTTPWSLVYEQWNAEDQPLREALCALGNGNFVTRAAAEEVAATGHHYPGTYLAGGYNRLESRVAGRIIENEDLVNWPNWLCLNFRPVGGDWFNLDAVQLLEFRQALDVWRGVLERRVRFRDAQDRETLLVSRRIIHMEHADLAAIEWQLIPQNWAGEIEIDSALDAAVTNAGVARYRALNGQHLEMLDSGRLQEDGIYLVVQTNQSRVRMAQAARTQVFTAHDIDNPGQTDLACTDRTTYRETARIGQRLLVRVEQHKPVHVEKVIALCSSHGVAQSEPSLQARKLVARAPRFGPLLARHELTWAQLWRRCDLELQNNARTQFVLRLHIFHLLQTASHNSVDRDVGIPARGWHGEAYRGHIFWDEIFVFPFFNLRLPELTRELLMYRYRRLDEARYAAREAGFQGAMYPWQSGSDGREESQRVHLNPASGNWLPDETLLQRHVNAAIAYNVWQYYEGTGDHEFLVDFGAEMILEIARFWSSIATLNIERDRYEIRGVVGPDEFHTRYPGADQPGLDNNAYTNVMAAWVLRRALGVLDIVGQDRRRELLERLAIAGEELAAWDDISRRMFVPLHGDGIISQFEGYEKLAEFDWPRYREQYGDTARLDRILEAEGDTTNRYQASKQADVLMLFFLFSAEELQQVFARLGYDFDADMIPRNTRYYLERVSHGSTLSRVVHAWVLSRADREQSWQLFRDALESDISDIQGGTTAEGIHLGAMAGTVDLVQSCYMGLETRDGVLRLDPCLPKELEKLSFRIRYRRHVLFLQVDHRQVAITCEQGYENGVRLAVRGERRTLDQGETLVVSLLDVQPAGSLPQAQ